MTADEAIGMRQRIMTEAARLFVEKGYNGISMREIALACGISKAGLYYHFTDKEQLFLVILQEYLQRLSASLDDIFEQGGSARRQVRALAEVIFAQPPEERAIIRLAGQELANVSPEKRKAFLGLYHEQFIGKIEGLLSRGMAAGELREADSSTAAWILLGMMYPFFHPSQGQAAADERTIGLILDVFFEGLEKRS